MATMGGQVRSSPSRHFISNLNPACARLAMQCLLHHLIASSDARHNKAQSHHPTEAITPAFPAGYCAGNMPNAGKAWPPASYGTRVALNSPQFGPHGVVAPCGRKLMFRGTGSGSGGNPISTSWQPGIVTNLCPE